MRRDFLCFSVRFSGQQGRGGRKFFRRGGQAIRLRRLQPENNRSTPFGTDPSAGRNARILRMPVMELLGQKNLWTAASSATVHNHRITRIRHARWNTCEEPGEGTCRRFPKVASLITFRGVGTPERMILEFGSAASPRCGETADRLPGHALGACVSRLRASFGRSRVLFPKRRRFSKRRYDSFVECKVTNLRVLQCFSAYPK